MTKKKQIKSGRGRKPKPVDEAHVHKTNVRLNADMKAKMREAMKNEGDDSESVFIRRVLHRYLKDLEKDS